MTDGRARFCRCPHPKRERDGDGVEFCGNCGELVPEAADVALPVLIRHVARLERQVGDLHRELIGRPVVDVVRQVLEPGIQVATVEGHGRISDDLHVLLRHRPRSISRAVWGRKLGRLGHPLRIARRMPQADGSVTQTVFRVSLRA
jgi:hypothetical protein